jgi:general secretion pathway protein H
MKGRAGFTLIEVLVVFAIMALIVGILMPLGARQRERAALASSARQIAAAMRLTRSRAVVENRPMAFLVDVQKDLYRAGMAAPTALPPAYRVALMTTEDQMLSDSVGSIRFYADGSSTGGGVALSGAAGRYDILVDWLTGGVSVHEFGGSTRH